MKKLLLFLAIVFVTTSIIAQNNLLFYNFEPVSQNLLVNPSNPHDYRFVIGFPALSGLSVNYQNTLFSLGDYLNFDDGNENLDKIISNLDGNERINLYQNTDLLYGGFGVKKGFVSFGVQQEATFNMVVPSQLLKFIYYGNQSESGDMNYNSSGFNAEAIIQVNYHVGYQHWLLDSTLTVGGRFKYISGTGHGHFKNFGIDLKSDIFEWNIKTDILLETSGYEYIDNFSAFNPFELLNSGNPGWAMDLGASYHLPKMNFSASVLNIGSITWKKDNKIYQSQGEFTWNGIEIDESDQDVNFDDILDSLEQELQFYELTPYNYKSKLPMQIMASYEYQLHPKHAFALTYQGSNWNSKLYNNIGLSYIGRWSKRFDFTAGYSRLAGGMNNIGAGFSTALGPVQLFLMCDNVWGLYKPSQLSATNVRFGINLVFYDAHLKKEKKEKKQKKVKEELNQ